ncbi:MAG: hypothetical protein H7Y13_04770 [Sphingobacteriaceae bacterium]|nr:hypothetical protein [Sphingobacteriaceae bacterium]
MIAESKTPYVIYAKTGWARKQDKDIGWWVGYVEQKAEVYFFATRVYKQGNLPDTNFGACRKDITKTALKQLKLIE